MHRFPTFYLSHGGGPWPYMSGAMRAPFVHLESALEQLPGQLPRKPQAILVISGHWEEKDFAVMASPNPPMVYDFRGFPGEMYQIRYPASGSPELAARVCALIEGRGLAAHLDSRRGFDHGTYSILAVTHPEADVPVIQVSVRRDFDPEAHLELGRALAPLRDQEVLIVGSGSSYHDLRGFFGAGSGGSDPRRDSAEFDAWLRETLVDSAPGERARRLLDWEQAPAARRAQPREDHLIPLHVSLGAAEQDPGHLIYREENFFGKLTVSSYRFGGFK